MDPENVGTEAIVRVTHWLRGIWEMRRRGGPVQQWVDSIPSYGNSQSRFDKTQVNEVGNQTRSDLGDSNTREAEKTAPLRVPDKRRRKVEDMTASAPISIPNSPAITMTCPPSSVPHHRLARDPSLQSDSSHCSSVESLLEWRRADPEAILLGLGFGYPSSPQENGSMARIPKRFLQPSKLKGIAVDEFLKQQQESNECLDSASLGYRGLTGSPYVAPSEIVQKIMERLKEHESHENDSFTHTNSSGDLFGSMQQDGRLSVLSPDNRQYLERPRSKSPDMRNKRMIIGEKSFAFGYNGDLIEIKSMNQEEEDFDSNDYQLSSDDPRIKLEREVEIQASTTPEEKKDGKKSAKQFGRRLAKQLSFDDENSNHSSRDSLHTMDRREDPATMEQRMNEEQRDSLVTVVSKWSESEEPCDSISVNSFEDSRQTALLRRASDGICELKSRKNVLAISEERRMSDSGIQAKVQRLGGGERKPGLKRQARVSEADEKYCGDVNSPGLSSGLDEIEDYTSRDKTLGAQEDIKPREEKFVNFAPGDEKMCSDDKQGCCKNDELAQICEHEKTAPDCCCHAHSSNCWRKMTRILKEKKDLEEVVAKKSREMALLREQLNSVMSVRMEPGF